MRSTRLAAGLGFLAGWIGGILGTLLTLFVIAPERDLSQLRREPDEVMKVDDEIYLRTDSGRPIKQAFLSHPGVLRVGQLHLVDAAMINLRSTAPGETTLTLVDDEGKVQKIRILVQPAGRPSE
jgi:hypothetical protein